MIRLMRENTENQKANYVLKKNIRNARIRIHQTHCQGTMISPRKVIVKARDIIKRQAIGKGNLSNYAQN